MINEIDLNLKDASVIYYPKVFDDLESEYFFNKLLETIKWQQDDIKIFGIIHKQPRLTALYASNNNPYSYSGITMCPQIFNKELLAIKDKVEAICNVEFTSCLLNLYRDGNDSNGWHSDDEKELGNNPTIASVSFGAKRMFHLKHKKDKELKHKMVLENGSLVLMKENTQHYWKHQIPKTKKKTGGRINLTFRIIK